jgi:hypothetical protein
MLHSINAKMNFTVAFETLIKVCIHMVGVKRLTIKY